MFVLVKVSFRNFLLVQGIFKKYVYLYRMVVVYKDGRMKYPKPINQNQQSFIQYMEHIKKN